jgi:hypothetical protein
MFVEEDAGYVICRKFTYTCRGQSRNERNESDSDDVGVY